MVKAGLSRGGSGEGASLGRGGMNGEWGDTGQVRFNKRTNGKKRKQGIKCGKLAR